MKMRAPLLPVLAFLSLALVCPAQEASPRPIKIKVTAEQANLRERPDIGSAIVQQIPQGTILQADKKEGEWYLVRYTLEDGGVIGGYIHESLVTVVGESQPAAPPPAARPGSVAGGAPRGGPGAAGRRSLLPIDIDLAVGIGTVTADDLNNGARGLAAYNGALLDLASSGSIGSLHLAYVLGVELTYRLSPWFGLTLGTDYLKGWRSGTVTYAAEGVSPLLPPMTTTHASLQAVPVKIGVRFFPGRDFYFRGSLGYYTAKAGYDDHLVYPDGTGESWNGTATAHTLGMELGIGGEWPVRSNLLLFGEAGFRLARLNDFSGTGTFTDAAGAVTSESGTLWYFQKTGADGAVDNLLLVRAARPSEEGVVGARAAEVNLSGILFRVGLRLRF
jgi:hypothetical protein